MSKKTVCVVGAGASGLMAAISAANLGAAVILLEGNDKVGKKLLATGNGRCNFTNTKLDSDLFWGENPSFVNKPLSVFGVNETLGFFESIGICPKDKNGYIYPRSLQAEAIRSALENKLLSFTNIKLLTNEKVCSITRKGDGFIVNTKSSEYYADKVIIATGGKANPSSGSDGNILGVISSLGVKVCDVLPALVPLVSKDKFLKGLSGVRSEVAIDFYSNNNKLYNRNGEIQFTDFGISGIVVFDGSGRIAKALSNNNKCHVVIDFMPDLDFDECKAFLSKRKEQGLAILDSVLNSKLAKNLLGSTDYDKNEDINLLAKAIKGTTINISGTKDFDRAQVSTGGVLTKYIDENTMEYKDIPGLYFCGEIIDIDGPCGGYNLQWAWTSGFIAGNAVND